MLIRVSIYNRRAFRYLSAFLNNCFPLIEISEHVLLYPRISVDAIRVEDGKKNKTTDVTRFSDTISPCNQGRR